MHLWLAGLALLGASNCSVYDEPLGRPIGAGGTTGTESDGAIGPPDVGAGGADGDEGDAAADGEGDDVRFPDVKTDVITDVAQDASVVDQQVDGVMDTGRDAQSIDTPAEPPPSDTGGSVDAMDASPPIDGKPTDTPYGDRDAALDVTDAMADIGADGGPIVGVRYNLIAKHSGKCMTVLGNLPFDGTDIVQWTCDGSPSQVFRIEAAFGGAFTILHDASSACTDVEDSGIADGTNVALWHCNSTGAQRFAIAPSVHQDFYTFTNVFSGKCVDVQNTSQADWADVQIFTCNGGTNQAWQFVEVDRER